MFLRLHCIVVVVVVRLSVDTSDFDYSKVGAASQAPGIKASGAAMSASNDTNSATNETKDSAGNYSDSDIQIEDNQFVIYAPAGKLGLVVDNPDDGAPVIHAIKEDSVLADQVRVGDRLVGVDEVDVRSLSPVKVSKLISKRSTNPLRKLTLTRAKPDVDGDTTSSGDGEGSKVTSQSSNIDTNTEGETAETPKSATQDDGSEDTSHVGSMSRLSGAEDPMDDDGSSQVDSMSQPGEAGGLGDDDKGTQRGGTSREESLGVDDIFNKPSKLHQDP
jgi:hypothetical protein